MNAMLAAQSQLIWPAPAQKLSIKTLFSDQFKNVFKLSNIQQLSTKMNLCLLLTATMTAFYSTAYIRRTR